MRKVRAFTLVELLVVIAIIALLLAVLVPSLNRARELAKRVVCSNHIHSLGIANSTYEAKFGQFAPIAYDTVVPPQTGPEDPNIYEGIWVANKAFRQIMQTDSYKSVGHGDDKDSASLLDAPQEFLCPSDKISKSKANLVGGVAVSYGYNMTDWSGEAWPGGRWRDDFLAGHGPGAVKHPAEKLAFIDGIDWWVWWGAADYRDGWDIYGQQTIDFYKGLRPVRYDGPVFYRHDEGANVGFYDGHVEYMKKWEIFVIDDWNASPQKPGMWRND